MKRKGDRPLTGLLTFIAAMGIGLLALLVLAPDYAQAGLNGAKPVSVQSARQADYSADPLEQPHIQPIDLRAVEQYLADQAGPTQPAAAQAATLSNRLMTPVATVTPTLPKGGATRAATAAPALMTATPTPLASSPTATREPPATATATPPLAATITARPTLSTTRTLAPTLAARASATVRVILPSTTSRPANTATLSAAVTAIVATRTALPATATRAAPTLPAYPPPKPTALPPTATAKAYP